MRQGTTPLAWRSQLAVRLPFLPAPFLKSRTYWPPCDRMGEAESQQALAQERLASAAAQEAAAEALRQELLQQQREVERQRAAAAAQRAELETARAQVWLGGLGRCGGRGVSAGSKGLLVHVPKMVGVGSNALSCGNGMQAVVSAACIQRQQHSTSAPGALFPAHWLARTPLPAGGAGCCGCRPGARCAC